VTRLQEDEREALRAAILARHRTVYAFWRTHRDHISKSVVFLVLRGDYPGNQARQAERMRGLLRSGSTVAAAPRMPTEDELAAALERVACARCPRRNRKSRHRCRACLALWRAQAREIGQLTGRLDHECP